MYFLKESDLIIYKDKTAIICRNNKIVLKTLKYHEVFKISEIICQCLTKNLVNEQHGCVGLIMEHNVYIPSLILSLQKLQHAFVFMEPLEISENISIINKLHLKWLITYKSNDLKEYKCNLCSTINIYNEDELKLWKIGTDTNVKSFKNICYVVQTSGTTGEKKLIKVENECIFSNIKSLRKLFDLNNDVIYFGTSLTFDPSMIELFLTITSGSTLLIIPRKFHINSQLLLLSLFCNTFTVTVLQMPPSVFLRWNVSEIKYILQKTSLRILALGGEPFPESIIRFEKSNKLRMFNLYGVTEMSCWASVFEVNCNACELYLGVPLDDTILEVRNENDQSITNGLGQLYIGSEIRLCYEIDEEVHSSLYCATGDLVQIDDNGIKYLGRINNIIKRFGHRVDLNQTENTILQCMNIQNKCIWLTEQSKLLLFLLTKEYNPLTKNKILDKIHVKLLHLLPKESFPDFIEIIAHFPLTLNGKIDCAVLKNIYQLNFPDSNLPLLEIHDRLWCKYFGLNEKSLSIHSKRTFFEMGGNSILIIQFKNELSDILNCDLPSGFVSLLYEESFETCKKFISNYKPTRKRTINNLKKIVHLQEISPENKTRELSVLWKCDLKACVDCSPIILNVDTVPLIAVGSFSNIFEVYQANTGELFASFVLPGSIEKSPCVSVNSDKVFVGCLDFKMYCISIQNKKIIWEYETEDIIKCTPCYCLKNTAIVFGSYDKHIYCLEEKTGKLIWKTFTSETITSSPIFCESIYIATLLGTCMCVQDTTGSILWKVNVNNPIFGSPCVCSNSVIWPDVAGNIHGIDLHSGQKNWSLKIEGMIYSSIYKYKNYIFFGSHDHHIYCIEVLDNECNLKFKVMLDSAVFATPSICDLNNHQYIIAASIDGKVYLIDICNEEISSVLSLPDQIYSSPLYCQEQIYVGCRDNNLYCIKIT